MMATSPVKPTITLATETTPDGGTLALQEHDGQHYLRLDGNTLMATTATGSEERMAELACGEGQGPAQRVLIGGLGLGFTLRRVLELVTADAQVFVAEVMPCIVDWNRAYLGSVNGQLLDDPRVHVQVQDVHKRISGAHKKPFDAILLDVDNSPDALVQRKNHRLYSRKGLGRIRDALRPGGRVVFWSAHRDKAFAQSLEEVFPIVEVVPAKAYPQAKRFTHTLFLAAR